MVKEVFIVLGALEDGKDKKRKEGGRDWKEECRIMVLSFDKEGRREGGREGGRDRLEFILLVFVLTFLNNVTIQRTIYRTRGGLGRTAFCGDAPTNGGLARGEGEEGREGAREGGREGRKGKMAHFSTLYYSH